MRGLFMGLMLLAGPVLAQDDWRKLTTEAEVRAALEDRFVQYELSKQWFYKSGKTLYESGRPSWGCLLYTSPSPRDQRGSRMPSSA